MRAAALTVGILAIGVLHQSTQHSPVLLHDALEHLYFLPIVLAGLYFGWRGGTLASLLASGSFFYHLLSWPGDAASRNPMSEAAEAVDFVIVGLVTGILADRERRQKEALQRTTLQLEAVYQQLHQNFERMKRSERLFAIGQLSAGLAHELRNPLAGISGAVTVLKKSGASESRRQEFLDIIAKESLRLNRLLTHFLDFARPRSPQFQTAEVGRILSSVVDLATHALGSKPIALRTDIAPSLPALHCDPEQLNQVILNLTINAIQATPERGDVLLSAHQDGENLIVRVRDQGSGIAPENLDKIFDPFFTTKQDGTGLGLSVAHQIVAQHSGILTCENNPDQGATFTIRLPLEPGRIL